MADRLPLSREALRSLRRAAAALKHPRSGVPFRELLDLARSVGGQVGVTVDVDAAAEMEQPVIVLQIPEGRRPPPAFSRLSPREREVAALLATGLSNKEIASRLGISLGTTKDHVHRVLDKLELPSRAAVAAAFRGIRDMSTR